MMMILKINYLKRNREKIFITEKIFLVKCG